MIRHDDAVDICLRRQARIFGGEDPLQYEGHRRERTQPGQVVPRQRGVVFGGEQIGQLRAGAAAARPAAVWKGHLRKVGQADARWEREPVPDVAQPRAELRGVHGENQGAVSSRIRSLDELLGQRAVAHDVELEPAVDAGGRDLLERSRRDGGEDHHDPERGGGPGRCQLAIGMGKPVKRGGRHQDRKRHRVTQHRRG